MTLLRGLRPAHCCGIIDDILDFSKIEAGKFEIHPEPASLRDMVAQVAQVFGGVASAKGLDAAGRGRCRRCPST